MSQPAADPGAPAAARRQTAPAAPEKGPRPAPVSNTENVEPAFLYVFPVERNDTLEGHDALLYLRDASAERFGELGRRQDAATAGDGAIRVRLGDYPASTDVVEPRYLACSFVIDCDDPVFEELRQRLSREVSKSPRIDELVRFVDDYVDTKTHRRNFDIASTVAKRRSGDCTEHATLLTALARAHGLPSRVVMGLALIQATTEDIQAFGHAWVEFYDGASWKVADAALSAQTQPGKAEALRVQYLPIRVLDDEGPGYSAKMLSGPNVWQVEKVELATALRRLPQAGR
jgi:transglutaminase-like putative cysteine protease